MKKKWLIIHTLQHACRIYMLQMARVIYMVRLYQKQTRALDKHCTKPLAYLYCIFKYICVNAYRKILENVIHYHIVKSVLFNTFMKHKILSYAIWDKILPVPKWHFEPKENKQNNVYARSKIPSKRKEKKKTNPLYMQSASDIFHVVPLYLKKKDADKRSHQIFRLPERLTSARKI